MISRHFKLSDFLLTYTGDFLPSKPVLLLHRMSESFPPIQSLSEKSCVCFPHVESLWVQEPLFVPIITHLKFRMCVGSKISTSHSHKQMMTRRLPRAAAEGKTKLKRECESPGVPATRRVLLPESNGPLSGCPRRRPSLGR